MREYYRKNEILLDQLSGDVETKTIHDCEMSVKKIPDPMEGTVLDPRVYADRKAAEEKGNPLAECVEIPVDLVRKLPAAPSFDVTETEVLTEKKVISTRNGDTDIYVYTPAGGMDKKPMLLFIHGGAFIAGSTKVVENFCKLIAEMSGAVVVGVDYRLAPEHYFPAGLYDCYDTMVYLYEHAKDFGADKDKIAVGGDSAGGTLAIGCCMLEKQAVDEGKIKKSRIRYEALVYPGVLVDNFKLDDYKWKMSEYDIPEDDVLAMGAALSLKAMTAEMPLLYTGKDEHVKDPLAAPLCAEDLSYLPKTLNVLCEYDYLRLQGEAFSRKLVREGVDVRTILYQGMDHEFVDRVGYCPQAYDLAAEIAKDLVQL